MEPGGSLDSRSGLLEIHPILHRNPAHKSWMILISRQHFLAVKYNKHLNRCTAGDVRHGVFAVTLWSDHIVKVQVAATGVKGRRGPPTAEITKQVSCVREPVVYFEVGGGAICLLVGR